MTLIRNWLTGIKIGEEIGAMSATDLVRPKINKSWNRRSILPNLTTKFGRQLGKRREAEEVVGVLFRYRGWFVTNNFIVSGLKMLEPMPLLFGIEDEYEREDHHYRLRRRCSFERSSWVPEAFAMESGL
jgi:hypothetical protein